jgi:hypothetical protein
MVVPCRLLLPQADAGKVKLSGGPMRLLSCHHVTRYLPGARGKCWDQYTLPPQSAPVFFTGKVSRRLGLPRGRTQSW